MYHTSAKLTFGGGEKNIWGYKKLQGRQKASGGAKKLQGAQEAYKKNRKNSGDLFFFFFFLGDSKKLLCRGAKNFSRGRRMENMVNVTPLWSIRP